MGDYRTTTGQPPPLTRRDRSRRLRRGLILAACGTVAVLAAATLLRLDSRIAASGYVTTENYAEVRPSTPGVVAEILVASGARVAAGDALVLLDDSEDRPTRDEAQSQLRRIEAQVTRRRAEIADERRKAQTRITIARLRLEHAASGLKLTREMGERGLASGRAVDDAELRHRLAEAELEALLAEDASLPEKELDVLHREEEAARDALARAEARLSRRTIRAPISGKVQRYTFVVGELVKPDDVLYELFGGDRLILKLRVPERFATRIAPGQPYRAELQPYRGRQRVWFTGEVDTMRDVIETENRATYRVVYCSFNPSGHEVPPGTSAEAWIHIGRVPLWVRVFGLY